MKKYLAALITTLLLSAPIAAYEVKLVAQNLDYPWSVAFLPGGDRLVAELTGNVRRIKQDNTVDAPIEGVPQVFRAGQGGLFDVLVDPNFAQNNTIYLSYAAGDAEANATTVAKGTLVDNKLTNVEIIYRANPDKYAPLHYGGRMALLPSGDLLLTTGDGFDFREQAQDKNTDFGKTMRIPLDGGKASVYSYGHRNPQGLAVTKNGTIYLHEHGPKGGDEVNVIEVGANYGWPAITYGMDYNGAYVSPFTEHPDMEQPIHVWVPSIAPSGLTVYQGTMFPDWRGDLFVGALVDAEVRHLDMQNGKVMSEQPIFTEIRERIRDIREAPDGSIYVVTDGTEGKIYRVTN